MKKLLPMLLAMLCACEPESSTPPAPLHILSISPTEQNALESKDVTVELDLEPRFFIDFTTRSARMVEQPVLKIGTLTVPLERYLGGGRFQGTVPAGLNVDTYDIRVSLADGREASLARAYTINPYLSFWIESIADQVQGQPFTVVLHADGTRAEQFQGTVRVLIFKGGSPTGTSFRSNPFSGGVCRQEITIDTPGNTFNIGLSDDQGDPDRPDASSNSFRVDPRN